jgi:hypothetical protein
MRQTGQNNFDHFLKTRGEYFVMQKTVRPSAKFVDNTLERIQQAHDRRALAEKILIVCYIFIPAVLRQVWLLARHDYFSVSNWPLAKHVLSVYNFVLASTTGTYILMIGIASSVMYLWGYRLAVAPVFKYIGHFFNRNNHARARA